MQIIITGRNFEVSEAMREQLIERIETLFTHYPTLKVSSVRMTMEVEKNHQATADIVGMLKNHQIIASAANLNLYCAIDDALEKFDAQLDKLVDKYKRPVATPPVREIGKAEPPADEDANA